MQNKKNLFVLGAIVALFLMVPLTIFILQVRQENRSRAQKATVLYFNTETSSTSPIMNVKPGDTIHVDMYVDPGTNYVRNIRYMFSYDPAVFAPNPAGYTYNKDVFPTDPKKANLEGPAFLPTGQVSGLITIGNNPSNAITSIVKVATFSFIVTSDLSKLQSPATISFLTGTNQTTVTSVDPQSTGSENVLSSALPAKIAFILPVPATGKITNTQVLSCNTFSSCQLQVDWTTQNATDVFLQFGTGAKIPVTTNGSYANYFTMSNSLPVSLYDGNIELDKTTITNTITPTPTFTPTPTTPLSEPTNTPAPTNTPVPTVTPVPTSTPFPTPTPTTIPTPTDLNRPQLEFTIYLHGIGSSGDNKTTASSLSNKFPHTPTRNIEISLIDPSTNNEVAHLTDRVFYFDPLGNFGGFVPLNTVANGQYKVQVKTDKYLKRTSSTTITVNENSTALIEVPPLTLVAGDVNSDNKLSILDYNMLMDCYSDSLPARACSDTNQKFMSDLNDDGMVNQFDYNLLLRELSVQYGE
jgi:hypothetical protein